MERAISAGGMGEVYRGLDQESKMVVAIKRMLLQSDDSQGEQQVDESGLSINYHKERFLKEFEILQSLDFPGIPRCLASFYRDGRAYIVMEFIDGTDLEKEVRDLSGLAGVRMEPRRAVEYVIQVCRILEHLHGIRPNPIVHRDVKPANILIDESKDTVALTDFSIAKVKDGVRQTTAGVVLGTVEYMAPELFEGQSANPRIDLYAVGVILYELLTGVLPFKGKTNTEIITAQLLHMPAHPRIYNPDLPDGLVQIAYVALQKNPQNRFATAAEMRDSLLAHAFT